MKKTKMIKKTMTIIYVYNNEIILKDNSISNCNNCIKCKQSQFHLLNQNDIKNKYFLESQSIKKIVIGQQLELSFPLLIFIKLLFSIYIFPLIIFFMIYGILQILHIIHIITYIGSILLSSIVSWFLFKKNISYWEKKIFLLKLIQIRLITFVNTE